MSLYGGIKFTIGDTEQSGSSSSRKEDSTSQIRVGNEDHAPKTTQNDPTKSQGRAPVQAKPSVKASAALKFAPRIRQPKSSVGPNTTYTAEPVFIDTLHPEPPTASSSSSFKNQNQKIVFGTDGKALAKAPAMTLNQGGGKRERGKEEEQRRKQKKKQRRRQQQQQLMSDFKPDEQYDPNRPNDLGEYQYYRKKLREEKRARLLEEKKRKEKEGSSGESSYYSDSEDEAPRRDAPKMWAPPTSIYGTPSVAPPKSNPPPPPPPAARPVSPPAPPASGDEAYARRLAMSQAPTGDDAYARRQAMSTRPTSSEAHRPSLPAPASSSSWKQTASGEDAYAQRQNLSARSPSIEALRTSQPPSQSAASETAWKPATSGDEAYARGEALSQIYNNPSPAPAAAPPPPNFPPPAMAMPPFPPSHGQPSTNMPPFTPSHTAVPPPSSMPPFPPSGPHLAGPSVPMQNSGIPGFGVRPPPHSMPTVPTSANEVPAAAPSGDDFARMLEERKKAAASIAERLRNLGPPAAPPPPIPEPDDGTGSFAEKMMRRWGHKEGTGLGADGSGIKHALTAEHVAKPTDPKQPLSKRQLAKQKAAAANAKNRKWVMHSTNRGKIVNANEEERRNEEQGKYGEASRIICLVGLVGGEDDIDEGLSEEIGEECSKYGIVERVVQHLVEPPPVDPAECLRVFVVFSGMAGAWRSVKELDGRFFGGRKLRATYFDETRFNAGDRDGSQI